MLEEIYKAGEIDARKLPRDFENLSAQKQVKDIQIIALFGRLDVDDVTFIHRKLLVTESKS